MSKAKGLLWVAGVVAAAALAVPALPWMARHVPWSVERAIAGLVGSGADGGTCSGRAQPGALAALDQLVARLHPLDPEDADFPLTVAVLRGKAVNAYAALGGHVYVYEGLLRQARSPEELAGVLAHEIAHVRNRHIIQGMAVNLLTLGALAGAGDPSAGAQLAYLLLTMKFSRQQEAEADAQGLVRLQRAQVDAAGFAAFFDRVGRMAEPPELLSSHPASAERAALVARLPGYPVRPVLAAPQWAALQSICE